MQIVGFSDPEAESVLEVVAAVLKLGNIEFKPESRMNGLDESKIKDKNGKLVEKQLGLANSLNVCRASNLESKPWTYHRFQKTY